MALERSPEFLDLEVALECSPEFLALEALLISIVESFEQYRKHGES